MKRLFLCTAAAMLAPPAHATDLMEAWQAAAAHDPDHLGAQAAVSYTHLTLPTKRIV